MTLERRIKRLEQASKAVQERGGGIRIFDRDTGETVSFEPTRGTAVVSIPDNHRNDPYIAKARREMNRGNKPSYVWFEVSDSMEARVSESKGPSTTTKGPFGTKTPDELSDAGVSVVVIEFTDDF